MIVSIPQSTIKRVVASSNFSYPVSVSIPQSTIKSHFCLASSPSASRVSIPQSTIKSSMQTLHEARLAKVSIPQSTIKSVEIQTRLFSFGWFQSLKARLKARTEHHTRLHHRAFQSLKARLKVTPHRSCNFWLERFNPSKHD